MFLEKWYGDFVKSGRPEIRYLANLRFGPMTVGYRGKLGTSHSSVMNFGFCGFELPSVRGENLYWPTTADDIDLVWTGVQSRPQILWQQGRRVIIWEPLVLNGMVLSEGVGSGLYGYVERLTLNFAPWHLGLKTLKWGRFCGKRHSLVWIEWLGRIPKRLALLNGSPVVSLTVEQRAVKTESASLSFGIPYEIINEPLHLGALSQLSWMRFFDRLRFLSGLETKWITDGSLEVDGTQDYGSVIYEEVNWP